MLKFKSSIFFTLIFFSSYIFADNSKSIQNFEIIGQENGQEIVRDSKTGLVWYPNLSGYFNWIEADSVCKKRSQRLPNVNDFQLAISNGIDSVSNFSNWYWTSTTRSDINDRNKTYWQFNAQYKSIQPFMMMADWQVGHVRCVVESKPI